MDRLTHRVFGRTAYVYESEIEEFAFTRENKKTYQGKAIERLAELEDKIESGELREVVLCKDCKCSFVDIDDRKRKCAHAFIIGEIDDDYGCLFGEKKEG